MAINLNKGQRIDLTKTHKGLDQIIVGVGWDTNKYSGGEDFDLDVSAFVLDESNNAKRDEDVVFYNNLTGANGAVVHTGDNITGEGEGDDEQIKITLSKFPPDVAKVAFTITIHDAEARNQTFGQVSNAFVRIVDERTNEELVHFDLGEDFSVETSVVVGELYRHSGEWRFAAIGSGFSGGLADLCKEYGLQA